MPEYLSPGVYVEEVNTGSKPIEGVSTSTAGMVGCTERGPEDIPLLVTSFGEFQRIFGGVLSLADFTDAAGGVHGYLPHAVQGFFTNDGRRNYIVRVLPQDATEAAMSLYDRGDAASAGTLLLRPAPQASGTVVTPPLLFALDVTAVAVGDTIRLGDGSRSEYRAVAAVDNSPAHVALDSPLDVAYAAGDALIAVANAYSSFTLAADASAGDTQITLTAVNAAEVVQLLAEVDPVSLDIWVGDGARRYLATALVAAGGAPTEVDVTLSDPLTLDLAAATTRVDAFAVPGAATTNLALPVNIGDLLVYPQDMAGFTGPPVAQWLVVPTATGGQEIRRIATLGAVSMDVSAYEDYPAGSRIDPIAVTGDSQSVSAAPAPTSTVFAVDALGNLEAGMTVEVAGNDARIQAIAGTELTLVDALAAAPAVGDPVTPYASLSTDAGSGSLVLSLSNRQGLAVGSTIRIGQNPDEEHVTIARIVGERTVTPDAGTLVVSAPLGQDHAGGTRVLHMAAPTVDGSRPPVWTVLAAGAGDTDLYVNDDANFAVGDIVSITTAAGGVHYHRLVADAVTVNPGMVEVDAALGFSHEAGAPLLERTGLIDLRALDRGSAGNRLLVAVADPETTLVQAELTGVVGPQVIELNTFTGVEAGTVIELLDPNDGQVVGEALKVRDVDRAAGEVELDPPGLIGVHTNAHNLAQGNGQNLLVRSREFTIGVFLLQRPDPAIPSRNGTVIDSEQFLVTMDSRHSRYIHKVMGTTWTAGNDLDDDGNPLRLWDRRSEGESAYIRVRDADALNSAVTESVRLGPEPLTDVLDSGQTRAARLPLSGGGDSPDTMGHLMYLGSDSDVPEQRTGIHALRNIQDISIVAVPGQTGAAVQQALINHCESDRYRFAILDAHGPNRDTLADVQNQRQLYDTKYAALYYPWLMIPEPHPANISDIRRMAIPGSGAMAGIYARTDNTRGVHKAPANEVVRGIVGLSRKINKREHDILNPYPKNINVIRDFRESNRGLRVWGARCITSDSDYKYVNVRRLMIFLEASIDRGLQWVVFEPNAEPLWARVRRAIVNFLTLVWRNGALEGTSPEQAFFVKCDRTTMTQTDIDSGRLICVIGVAPVKPAEFVIVRIGLWTADAEQ